MTSPASPKLPPPTTVVRSDEAGLVGPPITSTPQRPQTSTPPPCLPAAAEVEHPPYRNAAFSVPSASLAVAPTAPKQSKRVSKQSSAVATMPSPFATPDAALSPTKLNIVCPNAKAAADVKKIVAKLEKEKPGIAKQIQIVKSYDPLKQSIVIQDQKGYPLHAMISDSKKGQPLREFAEVTDFENEDGSGSFISRSPVDDAAGTFMTVMRVQPSLFEEMAKVSDATSTFEYNRRLPSPHSHQAKVFGQPVVRDLESGWGFRSPGPIPYEDLALLHFFKRAFPTDVRESKTFSGGKRHRGMDCISQTTASLQHAYIQEHFPAALRDPVLIEFFKKTKKERHNPEEMIRIIRHIKENLTAGVMPPKELLRVAKLTEADDLIHDAGQGHTARAMVVSENYLKAKSKDVDEHGGEMSLAEAKLRKLFCGDSPLWPVISATHDVIKGTPREDSASAAQGKQSRGFMSYLRSRFAHSKDS